MLHFCRASHADRVGGGEGCKHATARAHTTWHKEGAGRCSKISLPIIPAVLRAVWNQDPSNSENIMLWAACCLGFFGFLRSREMTAPEVGEFDPGQHLTVRDIAVNKVENPQCLSVRIKQSKTDPFRQGVSIYLGRTDTPLCQVSALFSYLVVRGKGEEGPLFQLQGIQPLTCPRLVACQRKALSLAGLDPGQYAGHSFRIGAATTAACGVPVDVIKILGRWKSEAYQHYVRLPNDQLSSICHSLARAQL